MTMPVKTPTVATAADIMEQVILKGDLGKLSPQERVVYYNEVCKSIGLNPLTQPLQYMTLQGKHVLYAGRNASDQLRKLNSISIQIVSQDFADGILSIHVKATDRDGRTDEDVGVVPFPDTLKGEVRSNTIMKAVTKAKRRVTLSISGLGFLDETEIDSIPGARKAPEPAPNVMQDAAPNALLHDPQTGEIIETAAPSAASGKAAEAAPSADTPKAGAATLSIHDMAREAASRGAAAMRVFWRYRTAGEQGEINKIRKELNELVDEAEAAILEDKALEEAAIEEGEHDAK